ncbi:MAG: V-type ATP synthase subunit I [Clostridia bacterium]|nr:V-type ATP synthase subunit I [Clostridia bacterium]
MIVPMKKLTLAALLEHREAILQALQSICAVQLISIGEGEQSSAAAEGRVQRLQSAEELLKPYAGKAGFGPKPEATRQELEEDIQPALEICAELEGLQRRIAQNGSDTEKRRLQLGSLLPWADMTDPLETVRSTASLKVMTGTVPAEGVKALMETGALVQLYGGDKERAALVICPNEEYAGIAPSIRATGFQEKGFGDIRGTASENIQRLRTEIEALEAERAQLEARLAGFGPKREEIRRALDGAAIDRDREQSKEALAHTKTAFLLTGWVREDMTEKVRREIEKITDVYYLGFEDPAEGDAVPTVLKNSRLITPYEAVTNLYSLPAYGTIDGTPLMAPFYFIFFGMMLSDTVYGAVLALGAWAFLKYIKPRGMMENLAKVLLMGGISTIFMGLLFGTCAGVSWPVIFRGTALENTFPIIDSSADPIAMLALCAAMGIIQMFYAVFIAAYSCIKHRDWAGAIVDNLSWVFIITGLLLMAAPSLGLPAALGTAGKWMAIGFAAVVLLFAGRSKKNVAGRLMSGAGKLYDVTSWLGDVLSYARIFALGLSTGVIGLVLNTLCWDMLFASFKGNPVLMVVGFIIVTVLSVALHAFMMAISTLGCFVHSARLQYVEFFGKFYEAGGKAFKPLRYETKYVNVK